MPAREPLITYKSECFEASLIQRVKRFSVEVAYQGQKLWIHSNNSGSMLGLIRPGRPTLVSKALNPQRKLKYTQEAIWLKKGALSGFWVGVNTSYPNQMLKAAFLAQKLPWALEYQHLKLEAKVDDSRLDGLFSGGVLPNFYVECKNVTLVEDDCALFPDAQSMRARKHLLTLLKLKALGFRVGMFYLVAREDAKCFGPCGLIDPEYAKLFFEALALGVEMRAYRASLDLKGLYLEESLPLARREVVI
ncbi:MAG: DNA/RNA nuclease SfsA [Desulfovibrionaceae bacterium]|nr:DNA/RNA nuclease SfsA [Desulfovibrionaceae bacterium]